MTDLTRPSLHPAASQEHASIPASLIINKQGRKSASLFRN
jgi:hypothetical protein